MPWTSVAKWASTLTFTLSTEGLGEVFFGNLSEEFGQISGAENVDLLHSYRVQESLDHLEGGGEAPRSINDI